MSAATDSTLTHQPSTSRGPQPSRFLLYSHDALGLGHLRRNLSVATALAALDPAASILLATSADEAQRFPLPPRVDILKLPGLRKVASGDYAARRLNVSWSDVRAMRASLLGAAVVSFRPTVLLADKHPLGVGGELEQALEHARVVDSRVVLGLRDVLDEPDVVRAELAERGLFERIAEHYDRVLVYGQPDILDARLEYGFPDEVARMTHFCGYVVSPGTKPNAGGTGETAARPHVLATAGGGEDGVALLAAFVEAAAGSRWQAKVVAGPQCDATNAGRLGALASEAGVEFLRFVPNLPSEFEALDALVCMGGYNTLTEAAASGVSTVCVPRMQPRREQFIRAKAFADRGLLRLVEPVDLDPTVLGAEVESAITRQRKGSGAQGLDLGGARRAARHLLQLAAKAARMPQRPDLGVA
jgi:predicted glycosyltransferase